MKKSVILYTGLVLVNVICLTSIIGVSCNFNKVGIHATPSTYNASFNNTVNGVDHVEIMSSSLSTSGL